MLVDTLYARKRQVIADLTHEISNAVDRAYRVLKRYPLNPVFVDQTTAGIMECMGFVVEPYDDEAVFFRVTAPHDELM